jgi:serine/threonine-protein kinase HipA
MLLDKKQEKIFHPFLQTQPMVEELIRRSFLSEKIKREYLLHYQTKRNQLNNI